LLCPASAQAPRVYRDVRILSRAAIAIATSIAIAISVLFNDGLFSKKQFFNDGDFLELRPLSSHDFVAEYLKLGKQGARLSCGDGRKWGGDLAGEEKIRQQKR